MDVRRLRVLRAVIAARSVNRAAASLGYTPSAISQHLSALQRETGLVLVRRVGRGIEATPAGITVAAAAEPVFAELARLDALVSDLRAGRDGNLSVSYFASAGSAWIPGVVATLTRDFPGLRLDLRLVELAPPDASPPDVAIVVDGAEQLPSGYELHPLLEDPFLAVVPDSSPLSQRDCADLLELRDEFWVDNDAGRGACRQTLLDACASVGFTPPFRVETQDYPTAIRFVAEGVGITVVPELGLGELPAGVAVVPIVNPTPRRHISVAIRADMAGNPAATRVLELLQERVRAESRAA